MRFGLNPSVNKKPRQSQKNIFGECKREDAARWTSRDVAEEHWQAIPVFDFAGSLVGAPCAGRPCAGSGSDINWATNLLAAKGMEHFDPRTKNVYGTYVLDGFKQTRGSR